MTLAAPIPTAPLRSTPARALADASLDDRYALESGRAFLTGVQALTRLPMMQRRRDARAGLNTGGFISGYRGSPLGGYDRALWAARPFLERHAIRFVPGVNEDLAATAVWGSQQVGLGPDATVDGVFAVWYGKGPGVDRSVDVLKHANAAGSARHGGVLALAGDDHACRSSTLPHQSEHVFAAAGVPVLNPADIQEVLDYGLYGWALSRFSGLWVGFKIVGDTADGAASVDVGPDRVPITPPADFAMPPGGLNIRWPDPPLEQEARLHGHKLRAALAFHRAHGLDRVVIDAPDARLGIITTGKAYQDVRQALDDLGIDEGKARGLGIRLYKVAMPWPLEPEGVRRFARGLETVVVVEEKRALIENQMKEQLYNWPEARRPLIVGKFDAERRPLLPPTGELDPGQVARAIALHLKPFEDDAIRARLAFLDAKKASLAPAPVARTPYFCSGCPHNTSTRVPEGSKALAGIGCHYMALWMDRDTETFTQMGGEGASWIGRAPFTGNGHVFANMGDGTYVHSGLLAIRAAVAAGVNITYKILYNDAVAMTGGQPPEGVPDVAAVARQVAAEGAKTVRVVTDEPARYAGVVGLPLGATIHHRDDLDAVQRELRAVPGTTVLIYDQTCATEKRRRRKRGALPDPERWVVINEAVCEGCGDCGVASNCLSIEPVETEFGRKRRINQASCNKDFSCLKGFCPSFVTVEGGTPRKPKAPEHDDGAFDRLPSPVLPDLTKPHDTVIAGVGGTGVVTVSALLGTAAHLEGRGVATLDVTGLAQKYGAVAGFVRVAAEPSAIHAVRVADGNADLLLGCDVVVAAAADARAKLKAGEGFAVVNDHELPTAAFTRDPDQKLGTGLLRGLIEAAAGEGRADFVDATRYATALAGDAIGANVFLLGYACQKGRVPVSPAAIERAIELNGTAVDLNKRAFLWGRRAAWKPEEVAGRIASDARPTEPPARTLDEAIKRRVDFLTDYQNAAYAETYRAAVGAVRRAERERAPGREELTAAAARGLFKLMAYKDEYEVARLYAETGFVGRLAEGFEGDYRPVLHLAPPLLARRDASGRPVKRAFGPWVLRLFRPLARLRFLRGTPFDPFGYTAERRAEREDAEAYRATLDALVAGLTPDTHGLAVTIASLPEGVRGFGHVKAAARAAARARETALMERFRGSSDGRPADAPSVAAE